jgi:hypothetical protein
MEIPKVNNTSDIKISIGWHCIFWQNSEEITAGQNFENSKPFVATNNRNLHGVRKRSSI